MNGGIYNRGKMKNAPLSSRFDAREVERKVMIRLRMFVRKNTNFYQR